MSEKLEELLHRFMDIKDIFEAKTIEKDDISKLIQSSTSLVNDLIISNQLHLVRNVIVATESLKLRHDLDNKTRQQICQITLEYSISFLQQSKETCFRRKFPLVGSVINGPTEKIETLLIEDKFLLNKYLDVSPSFPETFALKYDEARPVFKIGKDSVDQLQQLCNEPKFLLHLTLRLSQLYKLLSYFEGQSSGSRSHKRISKMNKRRLDAMMNLNKSVYNEQEVLEYLEEMGAIYLDYLDSKLKLFEMNPSSPTPRLLQKMHYLSKKGIESQQEIIQIISKDGTISEEKHNLHLKTWYYIAKFYNKVYSPDPDEQIWYTKQAIDHYGMIVSYCRLNTQASNFIPDGFKSSLDAKDMLERQIKAYQTRKEQETQMQEMKLSEEKEDPYKK